MTTVTPVLGPVAQPVVSAAQRVRTSITAAIVALVVVLTSAWVFELLPGVQQAPPAIGSLSAGVRAEIAAQESSGFVCSTSPTRTNNVVVENRVGDVDVVRFTEALAATAQHTAVIRAYCV